MYSCAEQARAIVGGQEQRHRRDVFRPHLVGQHLVALDLELAFGREPFFDLALRS